MTPHLTIDGRRATLRLDAPERRNALGPADLAALAAVLERIERDPAVGVAVVTAAGPAFCAGYDLHALRAELGSESAAQRDFARVIETLEHLRVPTVCAVAGAAFGGGADLALACDFRLGTPDASVTIPAARFGLTFYYGGQRRYVERLGLDAAKRFFLLAERVEANELLRLGYLHELASRETLDARVDAYVDRLLANDASSVAALKRSLGAISRGTADPAVIDDAFADSFRSEETAARVARTSRRHDPA